MFKKLCLILGMILCGTFLRADNPSESQSKTMAQMIAPMQKIPGYFNLYWDPKAGKLWLEISRWDQEFLFVDSLPNGIGSNEIGLDRGQIGSSRIVRFTRVGPKVLLIESNYGFRADTPDPMERRSVEESFARSVLWGFNVASEEGGSALVDATDFFLSDIHGVVKALKNTGQGGYRVDGSRSAIYLPRTKSFPKNTEIESIETFLGDQPGSELQQTVPTPDSVTVHEHFSFVELPDSDYVPRAFDPRAGFFEISYLNFAAPVGDPVVKRFIQRHRLQKKDSNAAVSEVVKPIVYYIDGAAPEPIRSALAEGVSWWGQAFEAAGFKNAFEVKILPEDADPMDVRYNVLEWVHRTTRGWSYGGTVYDPRTGEIIQGHVTLGSDRIRHDYKIAEGLLAPYGAGKPASPEMLNMALARIRQLAAHEVGHSLGLVHNFAASTMGRASVMDYPQPLAKLSPDGSLDLSDAYAKGIGEWDKVTIAYGYTEFPGRKEDSDALNTILQNAIGRGLYLMTDADARPWSSAHPAAHLWDNGIDPIAELDHIVAVRKYALTQFGENNIRPGIPMAQIENVLVPIYLYHRFQVQAVAKLIGGLNYRYALRGDGETPTAMIPAQQQQHAIDAVLGTIRPEFLTLPERIVKLIPPRPPTYDRDRELFGQRTGLTFDPLAAAETSSQISISLLFDPERGARLIQYHSQDASWPGLGEVIDRVLQATWKAPAATGFAGEVQRTTNQVALNQLFVLAVDPDAEAQVRAMATLKLDELRAWLSTHLPAIHDEAQKAQMFFAVNEIKNFLSDPKKHAPSKPLEAPTGQPIGSFDDDLD